MTASKTPRLGLMNPVGSDPFQTSDFATTMDILDKNPGVFTVPNQAARPTGWGYAQNGRQVWQSDTNILWVWYQPASDVAGRWERVGNKGLLASAWSGPQISTTTTNFASGVTVGEHLNLKIPGGRPFQVGWMCEWVGNSSGVAMLSYWENNVRITDVTHTGFSFVANTTVPHAQSFFLMRDPGPSEKTMNLRVTMAAHPNWGGTSYVWGCNFYAIEI